ncbi:SDR family oxidoreductase [Streptomyces sp. NPDC044780]|uniref:SDR family oxidoreductase n=1 Tax=unclassified Streptomyces TaxID=2593676 RepID=UPI00341076B2
MNEVAPGAVDTEMFTTGKSEERIARMAAVTPARRLGTVDLAGLVAYLAAPASGRLNGQVISTNGGIA